VSYLPTGLAGYSVGPGINFDARKLARTPRVTKKKKKEKKKRLIYGFIDENPPIGITNPKYTRVKSTHETNL
jgi:hypothetical protein